MYTPKRASWLNQIELWFSILVRRLLKRASFASVAELQERVRAFIDYFNRTWAKPFQWTYRASPGDRTNDKLHYSSRAALARSHPSR